MRKLGKRAIYPVGITSTPPRFPSIYIFDAENRLAAKSLLLNIIKTEIHMQNGLTKKRKSS